LPQSIHIPEPRRHALIQKLGEANTKDKPIALKDFLDLNLTLK